jgi:DNA transformation protein and related proteins
MPNLTSLINIGARTAKSLNEIGIFTKEDLEKVGPYQAWIKMKMKNPGKDTCSCALFALQGALMGICWYELPEDLKKHLQAQADAFKKSSIKPPVM